MARFIRTAAPAGWIVAGCLAAAAPGAARAQMTLDAAQTRFSSPGVAPTIAQTSRTTDISLGAERTVIGWSAFNLGADDAIIFRFPDPTAVVLNRVNGPAVIDGQVEALVGAQRGQGNVWFSAPGGVIFGPDARVNVGGLLATPGAVADAGFLDAGRDSFDVSAAGTATVRVQGGAELKAGGGPIALIAGSVTTDAGAIVTGGAGSTVLYGAADTFTVRFVAQPGGLDLLDFVVPSGGGSRSSAPLTLQGQTVAANTIVAVVNRADVASAVISAPGLLAAQSASSDGGDVVLSAGVDIVGRQPGGTRTNGVTATTFDLGVVSADRDLLGGFGSPSTVASTSLSAGRDLGIAALNLQSGDLYAGRQLVLSVAGDVTASGAYAGADATVRTGGTLSLGGGALDAIGQIRLTVGAVKAGALEAGAGVAVNAAGASGDNTAVNVGSVLAGDDIQIATTGASGSIVLGKATIIGGAADAAPAGRNLSLATTGGQADITYGAPAGSPLAGATKITVSAGRDATINDSGLLVLDHGSAGGTFTIRAADLELAGPLSAANVRVESLGGALTIGGSAGASTSAARAPADADPGLRITDAEFQNITVTGLASFYAGATTAAARGDLSVRNLTVDPSRTPHVLMAAGRDNDALVSGSLAPGVSGGVLTIGEAAAGSPWRPGRILVTGDIGFATGSPGSGYSNVRAFDEVDLNADRDVILGSSRFIALVAATPPDGIDIARNLPAGVAPTDDERDHIFMTTGKLGMSASQRIVQENTGSRTLPNGLLITSDLNANLVQVSPAMVVDLFGALRGSDGDVRTSLSTSVSLTGVGGAGVRVNGCEVAEGGCTVQASPQKAFQITDQTVTDSAEAAAAVAGLPPEPPVLRIAQPDADDIVTDLVTMGAGSDELWRRKRGRK